MQTSYPNAGRRPSALPQNMVEPIANSAKEDGITLEGIEAVINAAIEGKKSRTKIYKETKKWLDEKQLDHMLIWWAVQKTEAVRAMEANFGSIEKAKEEKKKPKVKYPDLGRRPGGLQPHLIKAIKKGAQRDGITSEAVEAVLEKDKGHKAFKATQDWLHSKRINPMWVWWVLSNAELEERTIAEFGLEDDEDIQALGEVSEYLSGRYIYATHRAQYFDKEARGWIKGEAVDVSEAAKMPVDSKGRTPTATGLLKKSDAFEVVFNEGYEPGCEDEFVEVDGRRLLNTYIAPDIKPKKGCAKVMLDHVLYLCNGKKEYAEHLLDWLAYHYQNPGKKINHAILMISPIQGVGKDTLINAMRRIQGESNIVEVKDKDFTEGRFDFLKGVQLVFVPETMGGDRRDLANELKPIITSQEVRCNEKFVPAYKMPNKANVFMTSNYENAAYIEDGDRRYFVIICHQPAISKERANELYDYIDSEAIAGFAYFLQNRDLSNFNPKANAPMTEYKRVVQDAARGNWESWLHSVWEDGALPFDQDVINIREALQRIAAEKGPKITMNQMRTFLKKSYIGGSELERQRVMVGDKSTQPRLWAVRNAKQIKEDLASGKAYIRRGPMNDYELAYSTPSKKEEGNVVGLPSKKSA